MNLAVLARPRARSEPQSRRDRGQPLAGHQPGKQAIGAAMDGMVLIAEKNGGAPGDGFRESLIVQRFFHHESSFSCFASGSRSEHPKIGVREAALGFSFTLRSTASVPALCPSRPRALVRP